MEQVMEFEVNLYAIVGEKQVRLETMMDYAKGLEARVAELTAQVSKLQGDKLAEALQAQEVAGSDKQA